MDFRAPTTSLSKTALGGLTLLLVVALASQVSGAALASPTSAHHAAYRVVQDIPVAVRSLAAHRAERREAHVPASPVLGRAARSIAAGPRAIQGSQSESGVRRPASWQVDLPPPAHA